MSRHSSRHRTSLCTALGLALSLMASTANSESLMEIYSLAVGNDPQFKIANADYEAAKESLPQSTADFLPSITFSAGTSNQNTDVIKPKGIASSDSNNTNYSLNLSLALYRHGNFVARRLAKHTVSRAEADYEVAQQSLILRVAKAYFGVLSAQDNVEFSEAEKRSNARQLDQTQQRFDVGLVAITDVHESRAAYDISIAASIEAANQLDSAKENMREITGLYHENIATLGDAIPLIPPDPSDLQEWTDQALDQDPALLAAQIAVKESQESVAQQHSGNYPTLVLNANSSHNESGGVFSSTTNNNSIGLNFNLPIYSGGRTSSQIRQALHYLDAARQSLEQRRRTTQRNVRNAYRGVISGISRVKALKQALISNQSALRAAEAGYEVGTRTTVDVLVGRRNLFSAQRDYSQARYNYLLDTLRLQQAAGSLTANNLKTISDWLR